MGDVIKKFFKKKKSDAKFKMAGPGHRLNEESSSSKERKPAKDAYVPPVRSGLTDESKQAASAALARLEGKKPSGPGFNTSLAAIKAQVKKELEAEKIAESTRILHEEVIEEEIEPKKQAELAVPGVNFRCPLIGDEVLPREEWEGKIREFLLEQMSFEPGLTAVLMLFSLNTNKEKVQQCVDTLSKYFQNILQQPSEEKYRRIRKSNKIFLEKVAALEGADLVLKGAGFSSEDDFYVYPENVVTEEGLQNLETIFEALKCAEPVSLALDRNLLVLLPSHAQKRTNLPPEFFRLTPEELKKEQRTKAEAIEKSSMLMTKAMREKEELRELRNYRYCLIRIRFPEGIMLQGTFGVYEPFSAVIEFLQESLIDPDDEFILISPLGDKLNRNEEQNLLDLKLVPASVLIFRGSDANGIKPEVVVLCQDIPTS